LFILLIGVSEKWGEVGRKDLVNVLGKRGGREMKKIKQASDKNLKEKKKR
jgi:hypothetical protein